MKKILLYLTLIGFTSAVFGVDDEDRAEKKDEPEEKLPYIPKNPPRVKSEQTRSKARYEAYREALKVYETLHANYLPDLCWDIVELYLTRVAENGLDEQSKTLELLLLTMRLAYPMDQLLKFNSNASIRKILKLDEGEVSLFACLIDYLKNNQIMNDNELKSLRVFLENDFKDMYAEKMTKIQDLLACSFEIYKNLHSTISQGRRVSFHTYDHFTLTQVFFLLDPEFLLHAIDYSGNTCFHFLCIWNKTDLACSALKALYDKDSASILKECLLQKNRSGMSFLHQLFVLRANNIIDENLNILTWLCENFDEDFIEELFGLQNREGQTFLELLTEDERTQLQNHLTAWRANYAAGAPRLILDGNYFGHPAQPPAGNLPIEEVLPPVQNATQHVHQWDTPELEAFADFWNLVDVQFAKE